MSAINFHTKEISVKLVYYGPGLCGKTTTLQSIYGSLPEDQRPELVSLATEVDRTIFFDFLPVTAFRIREFRVRLQLYTVPGQVFYNATRKLVLNGVDGLVFVADSQRAMRDSNLESLHNLDENLVELGMEAHQVPMVIACNKRDLQYLDSVEEMDRLYNPRRLPLFATVAPAGEGVLECLRALSQLVVNNLIRKGLGGQLDRVASEKAAAEARSSGVASEGAAVAPTPDSLSAVGDMTQGLSEAPNYPASLWPSGRLQQLGQHIERALAAQRWADTIAGSHTLILELSKQWAKQSGHTPEISALPTFLLERGVLGARYRAFLNAVDKTSHGAEVGRHDAMNAYILALESVW